MCTMAASNAVQCGLQKFNGLYRCDVHVSAFVRLQVGEDLKEGAHPTGSLQHPHVHRIFQLYDVFQGFNVDSWSLSLESLQVQMSTRWGGRQQWQSCSTEGHARQAGMAAGVAGCSGGHISQSSLSCQPTYGWCRLMRLNQIGLAPSRKKADCHAIPSANIASMYQRECSRSRYHAKTVQANRTQHCSKQQLVRQCAV